MTLRRPRLPSVLFFLILVGAGAHNLALCRWTIEDAAIDFAFAKHLVDGYGPVPTPGGEWTEGWSNPTWLALLMLVELVGADPFLATHVLGFVFSLATVWIVRKIALELASEESGIPLIAPAFLAASSQFAIWGTAGLENPLWNLLFALGTWRLVVEVRAEEARLFRFPWSAVAWLGVTLTRPEGLLYAAVAGFFHLTFGWTRKRTLVPTAWWLATFFLPWTVYQVWHYHTFAWPFPNTYYAKMGRNPDKNEMGWNSRSWMWTRRFLFDYGLGAWLPVWIAGVVGHQGWRLPAVAGISVGLALVTQLGSDQRLLLPAVAASLWIGFLLALRRVEGRPQPRLALAATGFFVGLVVVSELARFAGFVPNTLPVPAAATTVPPWVWTSAALLVPLLGIGAAGAEVRLLSWYACCAAVVFSAASEGDWMKGYRWYAMVTVPGALLFAFGLHAAVRAVEDLFDVAGRGVERLTRFGAVAAGLVVVSLAPVQVYRTIAIAYAPDASPYGVKVRIAYYTGVRDRIHWEGPFVDSDVDMGAHLLWTDFQMVDFAGLVDVPIAHHHYDKAFLEEYVAKERRPTVFHIHDYWSTRTRIPMQKWFKDDYVSLPGYPSGPKTLHFGNYLRRDALLRPSWPHRTPRVQFANQVALFAPKIGAAPASDGQVFVEAGMKAQKRVDFRVWMFATDGERTQVWDLPPAYDWVAPRDWRANEVFVGRFALDVDLPPGTYDLGYVLTDADGRVVAPGPMNVPGAVVAGRQGVAPVVAMGEVRFPGALEVLTTEERGARCMAARDAAFAAAKELRCEDAEAAWATARHHREGDTGWEAEHGPRVRAALASCWAKSADGLETAERVRRLRLARDWDFRPSAVERRAEELASERYEAGLQARAAGDLDAAYQAFSEAVDLDGSRTWARRYAEELRVERLGIGAEPEAR